MRVLHVLAERGFSGGEVQLRHLVEHLHRRGHHNELVLAPGAEFGRVADALGLRVAEVDLRRPWSPRSWRGMRAALAAARPDVLHFGCGRSLQWGGWILRHAEVGLKITTRRIDYDIGRGWYRGGRYRRLVDHVVANCESVRQRVLAAGVPEHRVTLVHEGIDMAPWVDVLADRGAARRELSIPDDALVVSCAATLRPRKGQRGLIRAFGRALPDRPDCLLILAGEGPDAAALRRLATQAGLGDRVRVPGRIAPVARLYAASDLFCMPSFNEGLSNACLEASATGLPLVVSRVGGLPEIVDDGRTGAVVEPGDEEQLSEALARFLADGDLRRTAGAAGAERTRSLFTAAKMAERMEALFADLLSGRDR